MSIIGRLIALSGIDGSGKSTCAATLKLLLESKGKNNVSIEDAMQSGLFFPTLKAISQEKKRNIRETYCSNSINLSWTADLLLNYECRIKNLLREKDFVILHRSELCCRVYSRLFSPQNDMIDRILDKYDFKYDLLIFLNIDPNLSYQRILQRSSLKSPSEKEEFDMLVAADNLYKDYLRRFKYKDVMTLDASLSPKAMYEQLNALVDLILLQGE